MRTRNIIYKFASLLFWLLGIAAAVLTVRYAITNLNAPPRILRSPESAASCTQELMEGICSGEFSSISQYLYGAPDLELNQAPEDAVGKLLWQAYMDSTSYEFLGDCYATQNGLARDMRFRCLDISSVTDPLGPIAQEIFYSRLENAEDQNTIYDESNNYREDFIQEVIEEAVTRSLEENAQYQESTIAVHLTYHQGQWLVVADTQFMSAVFGEITG